MTKGDKILIGLVIMVSMLMFFTINRNGLDHQNKYASIQVNGEEIKKITLDSSTGKKTYPIKSNFGYNLIEIDGEDVRVIESDCRDKLAIKQGKINKIGDILVCMPNRMVVEIKSDTKDTGYDILNY